MENLRKLFFCFLVLTIKIRFKKAGYEVAPNFHESGKFNLIEKNTKGYIFLRKDFRWKKIKPSV